MEVDQEVKPDWSVLMKNEIKTRLKGEQSMSVIDIKGITKDYGNHKGVFQVSFEVNKGEVVGFLGPNGAGKTTTIRQLMGFIKPDQGSVQIAGMDCFTQADEIQNKLGYLPGEIAFMDDMSGIEFLQFIAHMKGMKDFSKAQELIDFLELDPRGKIKKMSKGMKQKIGIVIAFMQDPDILILDEPTSGLDPLMQNKFVELIRKAKAQGKTILMSSHIFEEVEHTCDRVVIIKEGEIIASDTIDNLLNTKRKTYEITLRHEEEAKKLHEAYPTSVLLDHKVTLNLHGSVDGLLKAIAMYTVDDINVKTPSLEELFLHYYGGETK